VKFSIVTISYNQATFIERAIESVLAQQSEEIDVEYIIVDPGSSDGSREIIERYRDRVAHILFESDRGPADGLNKGFARATGDIFGYLNSDDVLYPGAFAAVRRFFDTRPEVDVVCGHAWVIDGQDRILRKVWSEPFERIPVAFGAAVQIQPSSFIRRRAFEIVSGFNIENRASWDSELFVDLYRAGAKFQIVNAILSGYRLHATSITNSGSHDDKIMRWSRRRFEILMGRPYRSTDAIVNRLLRGFRLFRNPRAAWERLSKGPIHRRGVG
jgi:glycosyltransferase involved in cell wall biosynthesis